LETSHREIQSRCRQENGALDFYAMKIVARLLWDLPGQGDRQSPGTTPLRALPAIVRARVKLRRCAEVGAAPDIVGRVWIHGPGKLRLGDRVRLDASIAPIELFVGPGGELALGDDVLIEGGTSIEALQSVQVGEACRIGPRCKVLDNAYHATAGDRRRKPPCSPVVIEAGATLGAGAIVLPGARVARGRRIPGGAVVRGRPAPASPPPIDAPQPATPLLRAIKRLLTEPFNALLFEIACLRAAVVLRNCRRCAGVFVSGKLRVRNDGDIALGAFVGFRDGMIPTELVCHEGARISIGARTYFNYGAFIEAHESVTIGKRCMIASMTRLVDRSEGASGPICIGDDVWIAHGAVIAAGVSIGAGSVVSAGSVVTSDAPANSLVAGNPARCMSLSLLSADAWETPMDPSTEPGTGRRAALAIGPKPAGRAPDPDCTRVPGGTAPSASSRLGRSRI
jgi:maltose O-acetyltransferase